MSFYNFEYWRTDEDIMPLGGTKKVKKHNH